MSLLSKIKDFLQRRFINWLVKDLFNTIDENDILMIDDKYNRLGEIISQKVYYKEKEVEPERMSQLQDDAERFRKSLIWRLLRDEVVYRANEKIYKKSMNIQDIIGGKMALWVVKIIENKLKQIEQLRK